MKNFIFLYLIFLALLYACKNNDKTDTSNESTNLVPQDTVSKFEAISLLGDTLYPLRLSEDEQQLFDSALRAAENNFKAQPDNLDNIIWYGRRLAYLSHYKAAIQVYSDGLKKFPNSPELYRHRGHRYITLRQFDKAIKDLKKAATLLNNKPIRSEANGLPLPHPNPQESSLQFNTWYHLGIAYFLNGNYGEAAKAYEKCLDYTNNDDAVVATANWLYLTYRRLGEDEVAERTLGMINYGMDIRENEDYYKNLLVYKGAMSADSILNIGQPELNLGNGLSLANQGYGLGNYYYLDVGDEEMGEKLFYKVLEGGYWTAFGYIAAEADLSRKNDSIDF